MVRKPRLHKRVTIKDVALRAGVSIGAVSRVLHGRASTIRVSEPTAIIIRQAALDLQYKPNRSSNSLRSGRTKSLTIVAPFEVSLGSNPYYGSIVDGIISHASSKGYTVCLSGGSMSSSLKFEDSKGKFDGIVWLGVPSNLPEEEEARIMNMPQVGVHLKAEGIPDSILNIKADEAQAIINYVGHLRVKDISKIGLFAKANDLGGLMSDSSLKDLCKRLAINFYSYKCLDEVPMLIHNSGLESALVWELADVKCLAEMLKNKIDGAREVGISAIVIDNKANAQIRDKHFVFPIDEMCKSAVDALISKIESPQTTVSNVALAMPTPV